MKTSMRWIVRGAMGLVAMLSVASANALCVLGCSCSTSVTASVVFAPINPLLAGNTDSSGNVRVTCGGGVGLFIGYTIALSAGASNAAGARYMTNGGAAHLNYNVYTSNTFASVWGDGNGSTLLVNGGITLNAVGTAPPQDYPVYGRIPGGQNTAAPGSYLDSLVVTLTYL